MTDRPTKRLALLSSLLFVPSILVFSWWAWQGFDDNLDQDNHRIRRFEELATAHVVNNLGFELFHLRFTFAFGVSRAVRAETTDWPQAIVGLRRAYRAQAHHPDLLEDLWIVSGPPEGPWVWTRLGSDGWEPDERPRWVSETATLFDAPIDPVASLEAPYFSFPLPPQGRSHRALVVGFSVTHVLETLVPELARQAFSENQSRVAYQVSVVRPFVGHAASDPEADLEVPLVPRVRFTDWMKTYRDRSQGVPMDPEDRMARGLSPYDTSVPPWCLRVKLLPRGLADFSNAARTRNVFWAATLFCFMLAGFLLFLVSILRLLGAIHREMAFSNLVSHELKTPLAAARALSENLAVGVVGEVGRVKEYGKSILEQIDRLQEMVGNILSLVSLESRGRSSVREVFDFEQLAREVGHRNGLRVEEGPEDRGNWTVTGNRAAVRASLDNLVTNALRHGVVDGEDPDVALGLVRQVRRRTRWIGVVVRDRGAGVPRSQWKAMFQPYRRGTLPEERQTAGSGLGLSLVQATMKYLKGRVQVKVVPGGGLAFTLWLKERTNP